jgi:methyl-accepting chemotaxis protein
MQTMSSRHSRKKHFIHPSSQGTYLAIAILPALVMSLLCIIFVFKSGESIMRAAKENPSLPLYSIRETVGMLQHEALSEDASAGVVKLRQQLDTLSSAQDRSYVRTITDWGMMKLRFYILILFSLILVALLALHFSHRIAGPMFNLRRNAELLASGQDTPPIRFRKNDEFQEIAAALEKLRLRMHELGAFETPADETQNEASEEVELVQPIA